jgi:hypothetical protein
MAYVKTIWENLPSESTPINASNLNKIEEGIYQNSLKADQEGDLTTLTTTEKSTLVGAINELKDGEEYSTSEIKTNKIWIDGKPIYRKIYKYTSTSNTDNINIANWDVDSITFLQGFLYDSSNRQLDTNYYVGSTDFFRVLTRLYNNNYSITVQRGNSNSKIVAIIIEYTKTTN